MNGWMLAAWKAGDVVYRKFRKFDFEDCRGHNIFRVAVKPYRGSDVQVGGQWLRRGDKIGELHLYNYRLQTVLHGMTSEVQMGLVGLREVRKSFPPLADFLRGCSKGQEVTALVGVTILHRGAASLGFDVFDLEDSWYKGFKTCYMRWMLRVCHPSGRKRLKTSGEHLIPKRVVMMRDVFFHRYGQKTGFATN